MKCPKCGYLGFETSDRCRNCGYDFSLAVDVSPSSELPLHLSEETGAPLADFDLSQLDTAAAPDEAVALDLDRIIGAEESSDTGAADAAADEARAGRTGARVPSAPMTPGGRSARRTPTTPVAPSTRRAPGAADAPSAPNVSALPLFNESDDDTPLITAPRPPRPPLSVRRTTPEIPRGRSRSVTPRPEEGELAFRIEPAVEELPPAPVIETAPPVGDMAPASVVARFLATVIDVVLLAAVNFAVVYLTLALAGLTMDDIRMLPILPLITFFAILDGGYLVTFIAASGQTIGKMATGIRVMGDDGRRVDIAGAVLRAAGCGISLLTAGLGYLPAFVTTDGRALQDRISGTRVVSAR